MEKKKNEFDSQTAKLGEESIKKLLLKFTLPAILSLVVLSLYNIIDRIFIGQGVGVLAISGLALTLPIGNIVTAIGTLVGVGSSARLSIVLGLGDYNWARNILAHALMLTFILSALFISLSLFFLDDLLLFFGGSEATIPYAKEYLTILIPASVLTNICFSISGLIRASGNPKKSMSVILLGVIVNIILDPIFIFVLDMGIKGAAIATAISMFIGAVYALSHFIGTNKPLSFHLKNFKLKSKIIKNIVSIGVSPFSINLAASCVALLTNTQLSKYGGDLAVGAFGIINSYLMFLIMMVLGFCQGAQPIIGFNYGAKKVKRVKDTVVLSLKTTTIMCSIGFLIFQLMPRFLSYVFVGKDEPEMTELVVKGLHICSACLPIIGIQIAVSQYFMAVSKPFLSLSMSISRQIIFLIPLIMILPKSYGMTGIWISLPISDAISTAMSVYFIIRERNTIYKRANK
ncbi:MAG: MATE family efflux transporter [Rikenellaceae bacterium]